MSIFIEVVRSLRELLKLFELHHTSNYEDKQVFDHIDCIALRCIGVPACEVAFKNGGPSAGKLNKSTNCNFTHHVIKEQQSITAAGVLHNSPCLMQTIYSILYSIVYIL